jgi:hypothetical protein
LREEQRPRIFEIWILYKIFRPQREKVIGDWRKWHNEELHHETLFGSSD